MNFKRWTRTNLPRCDWLRREAQESWCKSFRDASHVPLRENSGDLLVILFGDEIVEARVRFREYGIERSLSAIVRMKMQTAPCRLGRRSVGEKEKQELRKGGKGNCGVAECSSVLLSIFAHDVSRRHSQQAAHVIGKMAPMGEAGFRGDLADGCIALR